MFVSAVLPCMRAMAASITVDTTHYVPDSLAHAAMGAGSQAFWLLEPGIGARRRVARFMLIRASSATLARVSDDHGFLIASPLVRRHIEAGLSL